MNDMISRSALIAELEAFKMSLGDVVLRFIVDRVIELVKAQPATVRVRSESCEYCRGAVYTERPFRVVTQMNRVHEVQFNFCPHCGRLL